MMEDEQDLILEELQGYFVGLQSKNCYLQARRRCEGREICQTPEDGPLAKQVELCEMLDNMQQCGVMKESDNTWSCPVILTRKKSRDVCFYIAYRKINDVMKKKCFPLPWIDFTMYMLAGAKCIWNRKRLHSGQVKGYGSSGSQPLSSATLQRYLSN